MRNDLFLLLLLLAIGGMQAFFMLMEECKRQEDALRDLDDQFGHDVFDQSPPTE